MAEKLVLVGVLPEIVVIAADEQVVWLSDTGNLKIQFDPNRCPFQSRPSSRRPPDASYRSGPPRPLAQIRGPINTAYGWKRTSRSAMVKLF